MRSRRTPGLSEILLIPDPQSRGYAFQEFIAEVFRAVGFDVTPNAGTAQPRQTDLVARRGDEAYLIETKWENRRAGSDAVDALHSRLQRTSSELIGALFAYAGFSTGAVDVVRQARHRPVLLFDREAIEELARNPRDVLRLIDLKRSRLVDRGEVHSAGSGKTRFQNRGLPTSPSTFVMSDGSRSTSYISGGGYSKLVFTSEIVDVDWTPSRGRGVVLDMSLDLTKVDEIVAIFKDLLEMGWTSPPAYDIERRPRWSIQQAETTWHGEGTREFVAALRGWRERYAGITDLHHTEEFVYTDKCRFGFFTLTGDISADPRRVVWNAALSFQLLGIPIDQELVRQTARHFDNQAVFRPLDQEAVSSRHIRNEGPKQIVPIAKSSRKSTMRNGWSASSFRTSTNLNDQVQATTLTLFPGPSTTPTS